MTAVRPKAVAQLIFVQILVLGVSAIGWQSWNLTLGVLFLGFWTLPGSLWLVLGLLNMLALASFQKVSGPLPWMLLDLAAPSLAAAVGAGFMRHAGFAPDTPASVRSMSLLHVAAAASSAVLAVADGAVVEFVHPSWTAPMVESVLGRLISAFLGIMMLAPAWIAWQTRILTRQQALVMTVLAVSYLALSLLYILAGASTEITAETVEIWRLLLLVSVVYFALTYGWVGAVMAILCTGILVMVTAHLSQSDAAPLHSQSVVAIIGALGLLLGASIDEHWTRSRAMRNAERVARQLRHDLAAAAEGNMHRELKDRNRIAAELHDEFGQSLTALQTKMVLLRDDFRTLGRIDALENLNGLTRGMRHNITSVLERLRPAVLDELGLYGATDQGSIRRLAEDAGVAYNVQLAGDSRWLELLNDTHKLAAYRMVQEAVTNVVRHSKATHCQVRYRVTTRSGHLHLFVEVRDNGIGMSATRRRGTGLRTMQHRITALGGELRVRSLREGLKLHALLRQNLAP